MKILHIEDRFHPEMGYQINFYAKYHNPKFKFIILTSKSLSIWNKNIDIKTKDKVFEKKYNAKIIRLKSLLTNKNRNNIWLIGLRKKIKQINPDYIFIHTIESFTSLRLFFTKKIITKYPVSADTHMLYNQNRNTYKFKFYYFILNIVVFAKINRLGIPLFYTAKENEDIAKKLYQINHKLIFSSLIGTDTNVYRYDKNERNKLRAKFNISDEEIVIVYTGKINDIKQPHIILEALYHLRLPKVIRFFCIGSIQSDYYNNTFLKKIKNTRIEIIKPKPYDALYKYYSMGDIAVFPKENTLSSLDAQACKLPVIMEDDKTNKERLKHGGLLFKKNNYIHLAKIIKQLIDDKELRIRLGESGYNYISSKYNYQKIIAKTEKILEEHYNRFHDTIN